MSMPLALCGFMGTCKSTAGKLSAQLLNLAFIDTDEMVESRCGCSIAQIFAEQGEAAFRKMEEEAVSEALAHESAVVSLGGGAVLTYNVRTMLRERAFTVLLTATAQAIEERLQGDTTRPNLPVANRAHIQNLMDTRRPYYDECADVIIDTTKKTPEQIAQAIAKAYRERA